MSTSAEQPITTEWSLLPFTSEALAAVVLGPGTVITNITRVDSYKHVESAICGTLKTPEDLRLGGGNPLATEATIMNKPMSDIILPKMPRSKSATPTRNTAQLQWGFAAILPFTRARLGTHPHQKIHMGNVTDETPGFDVLFGGEYTVKGQPAGLVLVDTTYTRKGDMAPKVVLMHGLIRRTVGPQRKLTGMEAEIAALHALDDAAPPVVAQRIAEFALHHLAPKS